MSMLKAKIGRCNVTFPKQVWSCDHDHHSSSRCDECFPEMKNSMTMSLAEAMEMFKKKKEIKMTETKTDEQMMSAPMINGMTKEEIEKTLAPCPFCGCKEIHYGKTNNSGDFNEWVSVCVCCECQAQSYIWNEREDKTISEKDKEIESLSKENKELHSFPAINIYWKNLKAREDLESKLKIAISSIEAAVDEIDNCGFILTANLILNNALAKIRGEG